MTEDRVYFNSEKFNNIFNENDIKNIFEISKLKVQISKLTKQSNDLKYDYKSLIKEKMFKEIDFQKEYNRLSSEFSGTELKSKWLESNVRHNLQNKMSLIKHLIKNNQSKLKSNKVKISELTRNISNLQ